MSKQQKNLRGNQYLIKIKKERINNLKTLQQETKIVVESVSVLMEVCYIFTSIVLRLIIIFLPDRGIVRTSFRGKSGIKCWILRFWYVLPTHISRQKVFK